MKNKRKLRKWVKVTLYVLGFIVGLLIASKMTQHINNINQQALDYCLNQGYSKSYCMKGL